MKKIIPIFIILLCCTALGSCTNDEDEDKIEIITPTTDSNDTSPTILSPAQEPSGTGGA